MPPGSGPRRAVRWPRTRWRRRSRRPARWRRRSRRRALPTGRSRQPRPGAPQQLRASRPRARAGQLSPPPPPARAVARRSPAAAAVALTVGFGSRRGFSCTLSPLASSARGVLPQCCWTVVWCWVGNCGFSPLANQNNEPKTKLNWTTPSNSSNRTSPPACSACFHPNWIGPTKKPNHANWFHPNHCQVTCS